jgi:hypothetical protein
LLFHQDPILDHQMLQLAAVVEMAGKQTETPQIKQPKLLK